MRLDYTIWLYILIVIVILLVLLRGGANFPHALIFSIVIGLIFLFITKPPNDVNIETDDISCVSIYFAIIFLSGIAVLIYSGYMSYENFYTKKTIIT
uniref:Uncharacterized protein n=1 Tax=viral metagenome TaxID=1070528 RepID=A0A6C0BEU5_9ZZZZ